MTDRPRDEAAGSSRVRMAMIGGGPGAFIGPVHRMGAELDGRVDLVAGVFSRSMNSNQAAAQAYSVSSDRAYPNVESLIMGERRLDHGAEFIAIATPNSAHFPAAKTALEAGLPVISDKPATATLEEALALREIVLSTGGIYALTYTYTGYAMVREARSLCLSGALGRIRKAVVEYPQGWLSEPLERQDSRQAAWRTDRKHAGAGGAVGDIGVHAFNALEFVTGLRTKALCAQLSSIVSGRLLDDDCNVLLTMGDDEVPAILHASQIAAGARNGLRVRVWGEKGGLDWQHEASDRLVIDWLNGATEIRHAGQSPLSASARRAVRLPAGHPEGFIEAFATIYSEFVDVLRGTPIEQTDLQSIHEGVRGMAFIDHAIRSSQTRSWVDFSIPTVKATPA